MNKQSFMFTQNVIWNNISKQRAKDLINIATKELHHKPNIKPTTQLRIRVFYINVSPLDINRSMRKEVFLACEVQ